MQFHLVLSYFEKLWVCRIDWSYAQIIFLADFASQGVLNVDPTIEENQL